MFQCKLQTHAAPSRRYGEAPDASKAQSRKINCFPFLQFTLILPILTACAHTRLLQLIHTLIHLIPPYANQRPSIVPTIAMYPATPISSKTCQCELKVRTSWYEVMSCVFASVGYTRPPSLSSSPQTLLRRLLIELIYPIAAKTHKCSPAKCDTNTVPSL